MASITEENYLKALFSLSNISGEVNITELSNFLAVSLPTTNSMVKKLHKQGLVNYQKYKPLSLTSSGKKTAALILRKHRLTEMYLVERMGFGWQEVHAIAEQIEHIDTEIFFDRMDQLLGFPKYDPHGSPIPNKKGEIEPDNFIKLSNCNEGDTVKLIAIVSSTSELLKFLESRNISLGSELTIKKIEPYDNSMVISYYNHPSETLSPVVCERLLVERI